MSGGLAKGPATRITFGSGESDGSQDTGGITISDHERVAMLTWASLVHAGLYLTGGLDEELRARCDLSLAEQDLLSQVGKAERGLRMSELAERLFFSKAGMTKMVDRLELADLVRRERSTEDRRAISITLTPRGRRELASTRTVLVDWVRSNFADHLAPDEVATLGEILQKLLERHDRWEGQLKHLGVARPR